MLMAFGMFVFSLKTAAFDELQRKSAWRHPTSSRVGAREASQYLGPGPESVTLPGRIRREVGNDPKALETLRRMADTGEAHALVDGSGRVYGAYVVVGLDETKKHLFDDGTAREVEFTLSLQRVSDEQATAPQAPQPEDLGLSLKGEFLDG